LVAIALPRLRRMARSGRAKAVMLDKEPTEDDAKTETVLRDRSEP
jgi:hypothetical protein